MSQELNLSLLKGLEQKIILEVLHRDETLREVDEERIRNLKLQLQQLRWKGAKSTSDVNHVKSCARCQKSLGRLINRGAVCNGCSQQVCSGCRVILNPSLWMCTICYAYEDMKVKTGEWFFEIRTKKFPTEACLSNQSTVIVVRGTQTSHIIGTVLIMGTGESRRATASAKLLKYFQELSNISVVPPTPPPFAESTTGINTVELDQNKSFHRSMENLFLSLTSHIRKMSKSQNDMTAEKNFLTATFGQQIDSIKERRSLSDPAVDIASKGLKDAPSLLHLLTGEEDSNGTDSKKTSSEECSLSSSTSEAVFSAGVRSNSLYSINSTCTEAGNFERVDVSGEIEFAIAYIFRTETLEVCISACKNLAYGEENKKKCNPYIKTCLLPDKSPQSKRKTSIKKNTQDPLFRESFKYKVEYSQLQTRQLQVSVWHSGTFKRRVFLGEVVISFESWDFEDNSTRSFNWYQLQTKPEKSGDNVALYSGELQVRAKLVLPSVGRKEKAHPEYQLHVIILGANNLPKIRPDGLLNPFVKGCLCLQGQKDVRQRTPVLKKQTHPQWNHLFVFNGVTTSRLQQSSLDLTVWDQVSFGLRDQFLGGARLGKYIPTSTVGATSQACLQWEKMLNSPDTWTDITLTLYPNATAFKV